MVDCLALDGSAELSEDQKEDERQCHYDGKGDPVRREGKLVGDIGDLDGEVRCHEADRHEQDGHFGKEDGNASQAFHGCGLFEGYEIEVLRMELATTCPTERRMKAYQEYQAFFLIKAVLDLTQGIKVDPVPKSFKPNSSS